MLKVDLGQLQRRGRIRIDAAVPADDQLWDQVGLRPAGDLEVRLEAQRAGRDVIVRGHLHGEIVQECRRCLGVVQSPLDEEVTFLYRPGLTEAEAEAAAVYTMAERSQEVDLGPAVREHVILAAPQYPVCRESCRGLCPRCGADLNLGSCGCGEAGTDPRWSALRQLEK